MATPKETYHHGNLRHSLLEAALQVLIEKGVAGLTLREVARHAGVSHNAPYFHFANKAALIEAVVVEQFTRFTQHLQAAALDATLPPLERLIDTGVAYVDFATQHPAAFRLMFRPELRTVEANDAPASPLPSHAIAAYQVLLDILTECQAQGAINVENLQVAALSAWSSVHGLATILLDGAAPSESAFQQADPRLLAEHLARLLITGLRG